MKELAQGLADAADQTGEQKAGGSVSNPATATEQINTAANSIAAAAGAAKAAEMKDNVLKDGRVVTVEAATGHDVIKATRLIGQDQEQLIPALVQQQTFFDGKKITLEEILDLPAGDYIKVLGLFSDKNF